MPRYSDQERSEQLVAVRALLDDGATHRQIAEKLNIGLATVTERRRELAGLDDRLDLESATAVRRETGTHARSWLARVETALAEGQVDPLLASREAHRWVGMLAKLYGAFAPIRLDVQAGVTFGQSEAERKVHDAVMAHAKESARVWSEEFADRWQLPEEARDALFRKMRPWEPEDDRCLGCGEMGCFTVNCRGL